MKNLFPFKPDSFDSSMMSKRASSSRVDLSITQKVAKLDAYHALTDEFKNSQRNAAAKLGISRGALRKMLDKEAEIRKEAEEHGSVMRRRTGKDENVEQALFDWLKFTVERNIPLNGKILCSKAESIARKVGHMDFRATDGWFSRWKARHGIVFTKLAGEAAEADNTAANKFIEEELPEILRTYAAKDILNADETGIFFRALPSSTYVDKKTKQDRKGFKTAKDRITVLVTCALDGSTEELLVIGKSKSPRCFKNIKELPTPYDFSANSWMTGAIWVRWLRRLDMKMSKENRKVLVLADNCSAHVLVPELKNITVRFLPANTTSVLQPCDQGVIRALKAHFRNAIRQAIIDAIDEDHDENGPGVVKKITLLQAMDMLKDAWISVTPDTVKNCWRKGGFHSLDSSNPPADHFADEDVVAPPPGLSKGEFNSWVDIDKDTEITEEKNEEKFEEELVDQIAEKERQKDAFIAIEEDDGEDEDQDPPPTAVQMRAALYTLERGLQASDFEKFDDFWRMQKDIKEHLKRNFQPKQTTLDRFFLK